MVSGCKNILGTGAPELSSAFESVGCARRGHAHIRKAALLRQQLVTQRRFRFLSNTLS